MYKLYRHVLTSLPFLALVFWLGTLFGLLIGWCRAGRPHYPSMAPEATIPFVVDNPFFVVYAVLIYARYISDIGASSLQPLFIVGCCTTSICVGTFIIFGWFLRTSDYRERVRTTDRLRFDFIVTLVSIGSLSLILLSIFNIVRFKKVHWALFGCFTICYSIVIFIHTWELRPSSPHSVYRCIRFSFRFKVIVLLLGACILLLFTVMFFKGMNNTAALLEWMMGITFSMYIATLGTDSIYLSDLNH